MPLILIADNEVGHVFALDAVLSAVGYTVESASTPAEVFTLAQQTSPQVILLADNFAMPGGAALSTQLKAHPTLRQIPVVLYSDSMRLDHLEYVQRLGVDAVLRKPFTARDVLAAVRPLVNRPAPTV